MASSVADFFDRESHRYARGDAGISQLHERVARRLEAELAGDVLAVGGLWGRARWQQGRCRVTIADASASMLERWADFPAARVQCDARSLPFAGASFDHVVFPLVLHHLVDEGPGDARENVRRALTEAARVLRSGGTIWISDFDLSRVLYAAELALAPMTARLLGLADIPLTVMHPSSFYGRTLEQCGFGDIVIQPVSEAGTGRLDLVRPIIGLNWLWVPRALFPLRLELIRARRAARGA